MISTGYPQGVDKFYGRQYSELLRDFDIWGGFVVDMQHFFLRNDLAALEIGL